MLLKIELIDIIRFSEEYYEFDNRRYSIKKFECLKE